MQETFWPGWLQNRIVHIQQPVERKATWRLQAQLSSFSFKESPVVRYQRLLYDGFTATTVYTQEPL